MNILLRLILAHIVADFFLQTDKMNAGKNAHDRRKWQFLLLHSFSHAVIAYLFIAQWSNFLIPLIIFSSHFIIDMVKTKLKKSSITAFVSDQTAHIFVILLIVFCETVETPIEHFLPSFALSNRFLLCLIGYALMLKPSAVIMNLLLKRWNLSDFSSAGLPNAGKWIGYLERILILTFILTNNLEGIGFLLAAKSIFRFGDLNKAKNIKTTEYVMIGTLTSFSIAILVGYAIIYVLAI